MNEAPRLSSPPHSQSWVAAPHRLVLARALPAGETAPTPPELRGRVSLELWQGVSDTQKHPRSLAPGPGRPLCPPVVALSPQGCRRGWWDSAVGILLFLS